MVLSIIKALNLHKIQDFFQNPNKNLFFQFDYPQKAIIFAVNIIQKCDLPSSLWVFLDIFFVKTISQQLKIVPFPEFLSGLKSSFLCQSF